MSEMTQREFLFDDREEAVEPAGMDIEKMARPDASNLIWNGTPDEVLAFATAMDVRAQLDAAMDAYNAGIAENPMAIPFESTGQFVTDPAIRAALAGAYNDKRGGRCASYAMALGMRRLAPRKPPVRGLAEAFRHVIASRLRQ